MLLMHCNLSREDQIKEECKKQRAFAYQYILPLLDRFSTDSDRARAGTIFAINIEYTNQQCNSEAEKNRYNLRSN